MKKYLVSICAAFAMIAMVSCGGGNAAISAAEDFISNPSAEAAADVTKAVAEIADDEEAVKEYEKWCEENAEELAAATAKMAGL